MTGLPAGAPGPGIAAPRGAGDTGEADPSLTGALRSWDDDPTPERTAAVCVALSGARLLVPVVARPGGASGDETAAAAAVAAGSGGSAGAGSADASTGIDAAHRDAEAGASMAVPMVRGRDGRTALLVFSGLAEMARWNAAARPMPVPGPDVLAALLESDADALVLDLAGPVTFPLDRSMLSRQNSR
ncbi:MAG: SseB family protein [Actinomycetota bacterium]|nr:SseB family protein [Actinomycetota bacterium]